MSGISAPGNRMHHHTLLLVNDWKLEVPSCAIQIQNDTPRLEFGLEEKEEVSGAFLVAYQNDERKRFQNLKFWQDYWRSFHSTSRIGPNIHRVTSLLTGLF